MLGGGRRLVCLAGQPRDATCGWCTVSVVSLGFVIEHVREVLGEPQAYARPVAAGWIVMAGSGKGKGKIGEGETERAALWNAIKDAPCSYSPDNQTEVETDDHSGSEALCWLFCDVHYEMEWVWLDRQAQIDITGRLR